MKISFTLAGRDFTATTEHSASNHNRPVLLVDGEVTDVRVEYVADEPEQRTALDLLADDAGVWRGPETRRQLHLLAADMAAESGADYDRVVSEFKTRGAANRQMELAE